MQITLKSSHKGLFIAKSIIMYLGRWVLTFLVLLPRVGYADSNVSVGSDKLRASADLARETEFAVALVQSVRMTLRASIHVTDRYIACLNQDDNWFKQNTFDFRDKISFCKNRVTELKERIRTTFPKMKLMLALSGGNSGDAAFAFTQDNLQMDPKWLMWRGTKDYTIGRLEPLYSGLESPGELTLPEAKAAYQILFNDLNARVRISQNLNVDFPTVCAGVEPGRLYLAAEEKVCYQNYYRAYLVGDKKLGIRGFPVLGYLNSESPSDEKIIYALKRVKENAEVQLIALENAYYLKTNGIIEVNKNRLSLGLREITDLFIYEESVNRLLSSKPGYRDVAASGFENLRKRDRNTMIGQFALVGAGLVACYFLRARVFLNSLCNASVGIGTNLYFFWEESNELDAALSALFSDSDGWSTLQNVDRLEQLQFAKTLSLLLMPVGTGVPQLIRGSGVPSFLSKKILELKLLL
ncbi:MAG: hypothetical protein AB7H97_01080 [Pseudobdellovibrionaceae bacterium]